MGFKAAGGHPVPLCQVARGQMHVNRADTRTGTFVCCSSFGQRHKQNIRNNWSDKKVRIWCTEPCSTRPQCFQLLQLQEWCVFVKHISKFFGSGEVESLLEVAAGTVGAAECLGR